MKKLYVLYDASCGLCVRAARWLREAPAYLEIQVLPSGSHKAAKLFPSLRTSPTPEELIVIADTGEVYRDLSAWLMCLYALRRYRSWALRLSRPGWKPLARRAVEFLTDHRDTVSGVLGMRASFEEMATAAVPACTAGTCPTPVAPLNARVRQVRAATERA